MSTADNTLCKPFFWNGYKIPC